MGTTLEELQRSVTLIDCHLKKAAKNTVFSDGNPQSQIMFIGEAPGQEEDAQGKPFVGQSGKLLNEMLRSVGLHRGEVYITNVVFWRPPGNRNPSTEEIQICLPYVRQHISIVKPRIIVLLGGVAIKTLLETTEGVSRLRGSKYQLMGADVIATFHPSYLLRSPSQKSLAFQDMIMLKRIIRQ
jgi:DNA polymerase